MNRRRYFVVWICWFSLTVSADTSWQPEWESSLLREHPLTGMIVNLQTDVQLTNPELVQKLASYPVIFIGEKHDNPDHHSIEAYLIHKLVDHQTTVVFEMLDDRHQPVLAQLTANLSLEQLKQKLNWGEHNWPWQDYGFLFQQVLQQQGQLKAGNISPGQMMAIYTEGVEVLDQRKRFASIAITQKTLSQPLLALIDESHCHKMDTEQLQPMVTIQLAKDASMAFALMSTTSPKKIMLSGGIHARKDIGIPQHLPAELSSITVLLIEVESERLAPQDYGLTTQQADFVWFTPKFTEEDYCQRLE